MKICFQKGGTIHSIDTVSHVENSKDYIKLIKDNYIQLTDDVELAQNPKICFESLTQNKLYWAKKIKTDKMIMFEMKVTYRSYGWWTKGYGYSHPTSDDFGSINNPEIANQFNYLYIGKKYGTPICFVEIFKTKIESAPQKIELKFPNNKIYIFHFDAEDDDVYQYNFKNTSDAEEMYKILEDNNDKMVTMGIKFIL